MANILAEAATLFQIECDTGRRSGGQLAITVATVVAGLSTTIVIHDYLSHSDDQDGWLRHLVAAASSWIKKRRGSTVVTGDPAGEPAEEHMSQKAGAMSPCEHPGTAVDEPPAATIITALPSTARRTERLILPLGNNELIVESEVFGSTSESEGGSEDEARDDMASSWTLISPDTPDADANIDVRAPPPGSGVAAELAAATASNAPEMKSRATIGESIRNQGARFAPTSLADKLASMLKLGQARAAGDPKLVHPCHLECDADDAKGDDEFDAAVTNPAYLRGRYY